MTTRRCGQYLNKPWKQQPDPPHSFNCGELLRHIFKRHFDYDAPVLFADTTDLRSCIRDIRGIARYGDFAQVDVPQDFDIALLAMGVDEGHIGVCVGSSNILHCYPGAGTVLDDAFTLRNMGWRKIRYLRLLGITRIA